MGWRDYPGLPSHMDYADKVDNVGNNIPLSTLNPLNSIGVGENAEDILGTHVVPEEQAKTILSLPVGWRGDNSHD